MRVALYNALSCGGCDLIFFLEDLPGDFLRRLEVVWWPELGRGEPLEEVVALDLVLICGAVRTAAQVDTVRLLREKTRFLVAVGTCALWGGIPGLIWEKGEGPRPITEEVVCEAGVPGCPPEPRSLLPILSGVEKGEIPPEETTVPLCEECPRPRRPFRLRSLRRSVPGEVVGEECFLARGVLCHGPVTRRGCGAVCLRAGEPCRGCYGPLDRFSGERFLSALISGVVPARAGEFLETMVDPVGTLFRFHLAVSPLFKLKGRDRP